MRSILPILVTALFLGACASGGSRIERTGDFAEKPTRPFKISGASIGRIRNPIDASEEYKGPKTAAVAPVAEKQYGRGPSDRQLRADIQRKLQRQLDRSGIFAGVVALDRSDEGNEAEVIIEPALIGPLPYGEDHLELRVRVTEKTRQRVVLDERYEGDGQEHALKVAIMELEDDLGSRYQR